MSLAQFFAQRGRVLPLLGTMALFAGCASTTPVADSHFGEAVRAARAAQTLNPQASANRDPVKGIDGQAGSAAMERYQDSFKSPPKTFEILNIGGSL
ncbi:hypothetical protein [Ramlibacter sp. 2FC]|uniref:hypothetical protein n=1 Tax=Ramlibacter sp. 2FC TaxID=2502188 RepID=UPI00201D57C1|nr:hypothetical protein [Ramlibacter sp. 2FC]